MKIKRRKKIGTALLTATTSSILITACDIVNPSVSGNLMPQPSFELCIEVEPENAAVLVESQPVADGTCTEVYYTLIQVQATAEGYQDYEETIQVTESTTHSINMIPVDGEEDSGQE